MSLVALLQSFPDKGILFFARASSAKPLAWFRIGLALVLLAQLWLLSDSLIELYGSFGFVQWRLSETIVYPGLPRIGWLAESLRTYGVNADGSVYLLFFVSVLSVIGLLIGWRTRFMAFIAWISHMTMMNTGGLSTYGVESFSHIGLFYCMVMPVGACLSFDARLRKITCTKSVIAGLSLRVLQIHLCIVYMATGLEKARGVQWWNGEAIWRAVMSPAFNQFDMSLLAWMPWMAMLAAWGTLIIEIGYAFLIWPSQTRTIWLILTVALHLAIGVFMGLWLFSSLMIVFNLSAFGSPILDSSIWKTLRKKFTPTSARISDETTYFL